MQIILTNAEEAGMPPQMIEHCKQLLSWRIQNIYDFLPQDGEGIEILYSEKDPLQETEVYLNDEQAYVIYFDIDKVVIDPNETDREKAQIYISLVY
ncbi:MAG TPA: hypothetical protein PK239_19075 [Chitinophagales bacterium]|nr:hypothetical protein [Chitinophagales bacterium]